LAAATAEAKVARLELQTWCFQQLPFCCQGSLLPLFITLSADAWRARALLWIVNSAAATEMHVSQF